jgi:hypothetical protein
MKRNIRLAHPFTMGFLASEKSAGGAFFHNYLGGVEALLR